jgi:hypothetical protein
MLDEFHHGAKVEAASISGITSKNAKKRRIIGHLRAVGVYRSWRDLLGYGQDVLWDWKRPMISLADS